MRRSATLVLALLTPVLLAAQSLDAGIAAYKAQRWSDAEAAFRRAVAANAKDHAAQYWLGKALMAQDRASESEGHFERAVALQPGSSEYHLWLGNAVGRQAQTASKLKQPFLARRVKQEFETAVRLDGDNLDAREGLFQFYLQAPGFMGGGVDKARAEQREIARRNAYRGYVLLATLEGNQKNDAGVERAFRAGVTQFPDSAAVVSSFSAWLVGKGRAPEAWQVVEAFARRRAADPLTLYMVGRVAATSGQQLERVARPLTVVDDQYRPVRHATTILAHAGACARRPRVRIFLRTWRVDSVGPLAMRRCAASGREDLTRRA